MIVGIYQGDYNYYIVDDLGDSHCQVDVTQKFYERYQACETEREFIQSKLHRYYEDAKRHQLMKETEKGLPSKGF